MNERPVTKVLIQTADDGYLAREGKAWNLTTDRSRATVFDYPTPHLDNQLKGIPAAYGSTFVLVPLAALEACEICDVCGRTVRPSNAFFDGKQFLCPECKMKA